MGTRVTFTSRIKITRYFVLAYVFVMSGCGSDAAVDSGIDCTTNGEGASIEQALLGLINDQRQQGYACEGESFVQADALVNVSELTDAARCHSLDQVERAYFAHESKDGRSPTDRVRDLGYETTGVAENIAAGNSSPEKILQQWIDSRLHCINLMNPRYTKSGLGHIVNTNINPDAWPAITTHVLE